MTEKRSSWLRAGSALALALYLIGGVVYLLARLTAGETLWWVALLNNVTPYLFLPVVVLLPLALLLRLPRLAGWLLLFGVVGVLWFAPLFLPVSRPPLPPQYLTLITFNVYPDNARLSEVQRWLLMKNADLILLQEVDGTRLPQTMPDLLAAYPYQELQPAANGATLLSRYPITRAERLTLGAADRNQRVVIDYAGTPLTLFNVHLDMPVGTVRHVDLPLLPDFVLRYDATARDAQLDALLTAAARSATPYLLAGDFNLSEFSPRYDALRATLGDACRATVSGLLPTFPAGAAEELPAGLPLLLRLDYVWHSADVRPLFCETGPRLGSDHLPLFVALALPGD
ncbi:MAG: endonuclease/exonuclease/phosphatase family protein [Anaerolineae bacterium]|jgi:endonuclease/exonuclease/phosphatase (EEP) superfamily protein YafD|nr:endonuclease/exonuclease/phosphatase family protein [Anaerolineae bacterium]